MIKALERGMPRNSRFSFKPRFRKSFVLSVSLADEAKGAAGRLVRHSTGMWDDGGSLPCGEIRLRL
jgi:hypothetical protein